MLLSTLSNSNINLLIIVISVLILSRIANSIYLYEYLFLGLRFFIGSDQSLYVQGQIKDKHMSNLEKQSIDKFSTIQLSLIKLNTSIQRRHLISKQPLFHFYQSFIVLCLSILLSQFLSQIYHCIYNDLTIAPLSSWNLFLATFTLLLSLRFSLQILLLTSYSSFEFLLALNIGLITGFICFCLYIIPLLFPSSSSSFSSPFQHTLPFFPYSLDPLQLSIYTEIVSSANHIQAILTLFSNPVYEIHTITLIHLLYTIMIISFSFLIGYCTLIAYKMTQILRFIVSGNEYDKLSFFQKILLLLDFCMPLSVGLSFTPVFEQLIQPFIMSTIIPLVYSNNVNGNNVCIGSNNNSITSSINSSNSNNICSTIDSLLSIIHFNSTVLTLQLTLLFLTLFIHMAVMPLYLQGYLDHTTYNLWHIVRLVHPSSLSTISVYAKEKFKLSQSQLVMRACMFLSMSVTLICCGAALLRLTPGGTGIGGVLFRHFYPPPISTTTTTTTMIDSSVTSLLSLVQYNATSTVLTAATHPYLDEAIFTFLMGVGMKGESPSKKLTQFISRVSTLPLLPAPTAVGLIKKGLAVYSLVYFILYIGCFIYWNIDAWLYKSSSNSSNNMNNNTSTTNTTATNAAATITTAEYIQSSTATDAHAPVQSIKPFSTTTTATTTTTTKKPSQTSTQPQTLQQQQEPKGEIKTYAQTQAVVASDKEFANMTTFQNNAEPIIKSDLH